MSMNTLYTDFNDKSNTLLDFVITNNKVIKVVLAMSFMMYGSLAAPAFPKQYLWILDNQFFKVFFLGFIAWTSQHDPLLGIATAVVFLIVIDLINKNQMENFEGPKSGIYPGCLNIKAADILESFDNNKEQLLNAMMISRIPYNVTIDDHHAPLIATYLLNHGFALKSPCSFPKQSENIGY
jgi:hypothetical protein